MIGPSSMSNEQEWKKKFSAFYRMLSNKVTSGQVFWLDGKEKMNLIKMVSIIRWMIQLHTDTLTSVFIYSSMYTISYSFVGTRSIEFKLMRWKPLTSSNHIHIACNVGNCCYWLFVIIHNRLSPYISLDDVCVCVVDIRWFEIINIHAYEMKQNTHTNSYAHADNGEPFCIHKKIQQHRSLQIENWLIQTKASTRTQTQ